MLFGENTRALSELQGSLEGRFETREGLLGETNRSLGGVTDRLDRTCAGISRLIALLEELGRSIERLRAGMSPRPTRVRPAP